VKERHQEEFLNHVKSYFKTDDKVVPEKVVRAVFRVLSRHVTEGEIADIKQILPATLREMWP
jgi:uncharacterized protein (DUF2267 family)